LTVIEGPGPILQGYNPIGGGGGGRVIGAMDPWEIGEDIMLIPMKDHHDGGGGHHQAGDGQLLS